MSMIYNIFIDPFIEFSFMRRALVGIIALAIGEAPIGVFLILRRMALIGDGLAHGILPGVAVAYFIAGFSLPMMSLGGMLVGVGLTLGTWLLTRLTLLKEDAIMAVFYLLSLALGVIIISFYGSNVDLLHILFGSVLALDDLSLVFMCSVTTISLLSFAVILRVLALESLDASFLNSVSSMGRRGGGHLIFSLIMVLNLVASFQALGTLLGIGLMMIPAVSSYFWTSNLTYLIALTGGLGILSGYLGLLAGYHFNLPAGPAIILVCGCFFVFSCVFGRNIRWFNNRKISV